MITNSILCFIYISLIKNILLDIKILLKICFIFRFWPEPVDRPVDRHYVRSYRSTDPVDWISGSFGAYQCACFPVDRPIDRRPSVDRATGRLKWCYSLFVSVDRVVDREPATALLFESRSTGRSTEVAVSALTASF